MLQVVQDAPREFAVVIAKVGREVIICSGVWFEGMIFTRREGDVGPGG